MTNEEKKEYKHKWYLKKKEQILEQRKQYYQENKDKIKERINEYQQQNKDKILEKKKEYYRTHKTEISEYRQLHKDEITKKKKLYRQKHKDEVSEYKKQYSKTPMGRASNLISSYRALDKTNNRGECTLKTKWIVDNIFSQPCYYCGKTGWESIGCDRIDNRLPHTPDNVIPCCYNCNCKRHTKLFENFCKEMGLTIG